MRRNAAEKLERTCRVCRHCNGLACAGEVPGFGGIGTGSSFIGNVEALARRKLNLRVLHEARDPDTSLRLFGLDISMPILGAAVAGTRVNSMGGIGEHELADAMIRGPRLAGTLGTVSYTHLDVYKRQGLYWISWKMPQAGGWRSRRVQE